MTKDDFYINPRNRVYGNEPRSEEGNLNLKIYSQSPMIKVN